jgi:hypothetical protein
VTTSPAHQPPCTQPSYLYNLRETRACACQLNSESLRQRALLPRGNFCLKSLFGHTRRCLLADDSLSQLHGALRKLRRGSPRAALGQNGLLQERQQRGVERLRHLVVRAAPRPQRRASASYPTLSTLHARMSVLLHLRVAEALHTRALANQLAWAASGAQARGGCRASAAPVAAVEQLHAHVGARRGDVLGAPHGVVQRVPRALPTRGRFRAGQRAGAAALAHPCSGGRRRSACAVRALAAACRRAHSLSEQVHSFDWVGVAAARSGARDISGTKCYADLPASSSAHAALRQYFNPAPPRPHGQRARAPAADLQDERGPRKALRDQVVQRPRLGQVEDAPARAARP